MQSYTNRPRRSSVSGLDIDMQEELDKHNSTAMPQVSAFQLSHLNVPGM